MVETMWADLVARACSSKLEPWEWEWDNIKLLASKESAELAPYNDAIEALVAAFIFTP